MATPKPTKTDLTDAERAQIPSWHEKWVNVALRTASQTTADRNAIVKATEELYEAGQLAKPKIVAFLPSPLAAQIGAGYLAALFATAKYDALPDVSPLLKDFTPDPNIPTYISLDGKVVDCASYLGIKPGKGSKASKDGTENALVQVMAAAIQYLRSKQTSTKSKGDQSSKISEEIKNRVTNKANQSMYTYTGATMFELLHRTISQQAYQDYWDRFAQRTHQMTSPTNDAVRREVETIVKSKRFQKLEETIDPRYGNRNAKGKGSIYSEAAIAAQAMFSGGNMWSSGTEFISFYRQHVSRLPIDKSNWDRWMCYETLSSLNGYRFCHEEFSVITDFPEIIKIDDQNRSHGETTPSHRWRDGFEMFHWHGTRVPGEWILKRQELTPAIALGQTNLELRRAACEIIGWARILDELKAKTLDKDDDPEVGELVEVTIPANGGVEAVTARFLRVKCGTGRDFALGIPPNIRTAMQAQAWLMGFDDEKEFKLPEVRA